MNPLFSMACRITRKLLFPTSYSSEMRVNLLVYTLPLMILGDVATKIVKYRQYLVP